MKPFSVFFLVFLVTASSVFSERTIEIRPEIKEISLGKKLVYLEDPSQEIGISQITKTESSQFSTSPEEILNFGNTASSVWLKFTLSFPNTLDKQYYLYFDYPLLDTITLFVPDGKGGFLEKNSGRFTKHSTRDVQHRNFLFQIDPHKEPRTYYIRVAAACGLSIPIELVEGGWFHDRERTIQFVQGMFFGCMIVMAIYNLFVYFVTRIFGYLVYVVYVLIGNVLFQLFMSGFAGEYLFAELPSVHVNLHNIVYALTQSIGLCVVLIMFDLRNFSKKIFYYFIFLLSLSVLGISLIPMLSYTDINVILDAITILQVVSILTFVTFRVLKEPKMLYIFFWLGFFSLGLGAAVTIFKYIGLLPANFFTNYAYQLGGVAEVVLLSFAFGFQINTLQKEKNYFLHEVKNQKSILDTIQSELEVARKIQVSTLPDKFPVVSGIRVEARYFPASYIGGDFYDYVVDGEQGMGIILADVTGHGVPASLEAAMLKIAFSTQKEHKTDPVKVLNGINSIFNSGYAKHLHSAVYLHINSEKKLLRVANAGHPALFLIRSDQIQVIRPKGKLVGFSNDLGLEELLVDLLPGDRIFVYTDGLTDVYHPAKGEFGEQRLREFLIKNRYLSTEKVSTLLFHELLHWSNSSSPGDDITFLVIDFQIERYDRVF